MKSEDSNSKKWMIGSGAAILIAAAILTGSSSKPNAPDSDPLDQAEATSEVLPIQKQTTEPAVEPSAVLPHDESPPDPAPDCDSNYSPCVPNVSYDLDCGDIGFTVTVIGTDRHRFDRDGDGYGCESY